MFRLTSCNDVLVLEENTLGGTSTARRVHDTEQILGGWGNSVDGILLSLLDKVVKACDGQMGVGVLELLDVLFLDLVLAVVDDVLNLDVFTFLERLDELGKKMRVKEDGLGVSLLKRMLETFLSKGVVSSNNGH